MKSTKTAKELAVFLDSGSTPATREQAQEVAAFLGVELAPERPALPGWVEDGPTRLEGTTIRSSTGHVLLFNDNYAQGSEAISRARANRAAFVEIHRRWLATLRKLQSWAREGSSTTAFEAASEALLLSLGKEAP